MPTSEFRIIYMPFTPYRRRSESNHFQANKATFHLGFASLPLLRKFEREKNDRGAFNELPEI